MTTEPEPSLARRRAGEKDTLIPGELIYWMDIHPDGAETPRSGHVWSPASAIPGIGRTWWVIPFDPIDRKSHPSAVLVARASKQHACGRYTSHRWYAQGGRLIDQGEHYRETDARGRVNERGITKPERPRSISGRATKPFAQTELDNYERMIAEFAREAAAVTDNQQGE